MFRIVNGANAQWQFYGTALLQSVPNYQRRSVSSKMAAKFVGYP